MFTRKMLKIGVTQHILVTLTISLFFLPNITDAQTSVKKNWITFGLLCPTSGPIAMYGQHMVNTVKLVVEEVNTKWNPPGGGLIIKGERYYLKYEYYDDEGDPAKGVAGFRKLVEMYKVAYIIGPFGTPQALATIPVSEELKTLFTAFTASDKAHRMGNPYMLSNRVPAKYFGGPMAKACFDRGWKKYALLTDVSDAWTSMGEEFKKEMGRLGGKSVGDDMVDTKTVIDFRSIMTKFKNAKPDVIAIFAYTEPLVTMVNHAREVGYTGRFVANNDYNADALKIAGIKNSVGILTEKMYWDMCIAYPELDKTGAVTYLSNLYKARYPGVPLHDVISTAWDSTLTWPKAIEVAGTFTDAPAIHRSLDKAVKLLADKFTIPHDGVLPSGMITGVVEFIAEIQPDGSFKKVGELVVPADKLR